MAACLVSQVDCAVRCGESPIEIATMTSAELWVEQVGEFTSDTTERECSQDCTSYSGNSATNSAVVLRIIGKPLTKLLIAA